MKDNAQTDLGLQLSNYSTSVIWLHTVCLRDRYLCVDNIILCLYTSLSPDDNDKTFSSTESAKAVRLESSGQSGGYRRGSMVGRICRIGVFYFNSGMLERGSDGGVR